MGLPNPAVAAATNPPPVVTVPPAVLLKEILGVLEEIRDRLEAIHVSVNAHARGEA